MPTLNLKRLSITELNTLAGEIIDELSTRDTEESSDDFIKEIIKVYDEEYELQEELASLEIDKEFIDDDIERVKEEREALENKESDLFYKLSVDELHL